MLTVKLKVKIKIELSETTKLFEFECSNSFKSEIKCEIE